MIARPESPARPSREEKKARTRAQLLAAAATVFARRGYVAASLDEVAEEAGLTKGAVYSNFENKEDLFDAVISDRLDEPMRHRAALIDSTTGTSEEHAMVGAQIFVEAVERERELFLLSLEYYIYVARHPELASDFNARRHEALDGIADLIVKHVHGTGDDLPLPPNEMAIAVEALSQGIALQRLADPQSVPDDLIGRLYAMVFRLTDEPESPK